MKLTGYDGTCVFDKLTQTLTWTLDTLNIGGSSTLELVLKAVDNGTYIIEPQITANTTIDMMTNGSLAINVQKESHNNTNGTDNHTNIPDTGIPIFLLIIGIIMVIGGILVKK